MKARTAGRKLSAVFGRIQGGKVFMNWIKRAFRSISYHKKYNSDVFKFPDFIHPDPVWLMYPRGKSGTDMGDSDEHRRKRACIE